MLTLERLVPTDINGSRSIGISHTKGFRGRSANLSKYSPPQSLGHENGGENGPTRASIECFELDNLGDQDNSFQEVPIRKVARNKTTTLYRLQGSLQSRAYLVHSSNSKSTKDNMKGAEKAL